MQKLRLKLEELSLESFESVPVAADARGTVQGHFAANTNQVKCTYFCTYACPSSTFVC